MLEEEGTLECRSQPQRSRPATLSVAFLVSTGRCLGLSLTPAQAARLWGVQLHDADGILRQLVTTGFLTRTSTGAYVMTRA